MAPFLPRLQIWVENAMDHTFNHNVGECICKNKQKSLLKDVLDKKKMQIGERDRTVRQQVGVSQKQHDRLMRKFTKKEEQQ